MRKLFLSAVSLLLLVNLPAQSNDRYFNAAEVARIEGILASDAMQGRRTFTPGIDKAAAFIAEEFRSAQLAPYPGTKDYLQSFALLRPRLISLQVQFNGEPADTKNVIVFTSKDTLLVNNTSGYRQVNIAAGDNFMTVARKYVGANANYVVVVDTAHARMFGNLTRLKSQQFQSEYSTIFVLSASLPANYSIEAIHSFTRQPLSNVAAYIPGKSRPDEYVIFSAHYDHLGIMSKDRQGNVLTDSIFNGANDDAAGTTAVIMLARYFKALNNNARSLIFVAFTAEEVGGFGATYFSRQLPPEKVVAMLNIEMIGTESKWGTNSAYITGYEKSSLGTILQQNLTGSGFTFHPDPYTEQNLFYRSDNATLARLGVPAHTISTSKMDNEPNYHKASDEIGTLDLENMARIIRSIAISAGTIISGKDTPSRVDTGQLR
ncbi:MAG: M28 family peptidase [Chitinophagaceae bacterium]|nr:M28 family peptidase [Chitinophagaceae bacterium]MCA6513053.1 M28 family peptidase [Chitinophagaceae bacterium]